ncbi:unnamed protein product [Chrysodeixis includens]|uniref:Uncharacterized protein n=1 Tax=Chrysodeixis includens TaxID=689277 RepID=A0A9P0C3N8_CHRIL|nr:unnamed protein product [Chrysodeixis includens]
MPERPKRRKNNKNKRKNKNNKPDTNKNNSDTKTIDNSESCQSQNDNVEEIAESEVIGTEIIKSEILQTVLETSNTGSSSSDVVNLNGDLNNNSNQVITDELATTQVEGTKDLEIIDTAYVVESPENSLQSKAKLSNKLKSKSLDDDEATKIIEITEEIINAQPGDENALALIDSQNVVVTHVDSDIEWENATDLNENKNQSQEIATGTLSVTSIPLSVAQIDQTKCLTPDEEKSLRKYLNTLNLATQPESLNSVEIKTEIEQIINQEIKHRLRKKALADDFFLQRLGPPRMLDVIDEEGSSGSSMTSRRQSYLSEKRSDVEDLEDDVFEDNKNKLTKQKKMMTSSVVHKKGFGKLVPQECMLVGAKIKAPEVTEARGDWTMQTMEKMTGAEVVYLTDTSSSTSSLHEIEDEDDGVDTDVTVRMITPTIEVTDTENFLKKTFISNNTDVTEKQSGDTENKQFEENNVLTQNISNKLEFEMSKKQSKTENVASEHIIKVSLEEDRPINNTLEENNKKQVQLKCEKEVQENRQNVVKTNNNEHVVKIVYEPNTKNTNKSSPNLKENNERIIPVQYEKSPELNVGHAASNSHEIVVLSTDNIKTNLYVKDIDESIVKEDKKTQQTQNKFDLQSKVIKCEFNDAINNLIKEVASESEDTNENLKEPITRQDSSSSVDSSQCTAKYNPNYSSLNDIANITHDEINGNKTNTDQISSTTSHVKDVFECVTGTTTKSNTISDDSKEPLKLRDICVRNIASLPYGKNILEELAYVSERLQNIALYGETPSKIVDNQSEKENMPHYRLPDVSSIEAIAIPTKPKDPKPPPIQPRNSSLKKTSQDDDHWTGIPTQSEPVYVCLSPSQKMLMEKTNTVITKDDATHLVDMHKKFVDRRGYNEHYKNEKESVENEYEQPVVVPFKSQTGSRLLALIRDPALTNNINSLNDRLNSSSSEIHRKHTPTLFSKPNHDRFPSRDFSFKPIPPPRPKKYSSSFYESDESSDFTDNSMRSMKSEKKYFHYSTGNLNKEIESDISSIQNMHRYFTDTRDEMNDYKTPRRPSLPKDLCEQQMEYIRKKEKEVEAEIQRLEALKSSMPEMQRQGPKAPLISEKEIIEERVKDANNYFVSRKKDIVMNSQGSDHKKSKMSSVFSSSQEELLREKMYSEYVTQMAQREERKQHKVIKITNSPATTNNITISKSMPTLDVLDSKVNNRIEKEFISKARERWDKLGIKDPETEDEQDSSKNVYKEPKVIEHKIKVIECGQEKDVKKLPNHLQEFVRFTAKDSEQATSSSGESKPGRASPHLVVMCAVIIIVIAVGKYLLRLLRNK